MTSSFDAYDLMRRSILSSIMGLRRKPRPTVPVVGQRPTVSASCSSAVPRIFVHQSEVERTPHDIYREIVNECEQIERSGTSSPLSDFDSCPTSPAGNPIPPPSPLVASYSMPMQAFAMDSNTQMYAAPLPTGDFAGAAALVGAPPPYSALPVTPLEDIPGLFSEPLPEAMLGSQPLLLHPIKREDSVGTVSIEEIVRLVVSAMKNSGLAEAVQESPEEVLRRKRQQNNEAAARYRKRQREARNIAEGELEQLLRRNEDLRHTVERMQQEIADLKQAVLAGHTS